MGIVYLARELATTRLVAIKLLGTVHAGNAEAALRFAREARTVAALDHPHIVRTLAIEELSRGAVAMVNEYVPGQTLRVLLRESGALSFDHAAMLLRHVAAALAHAHHVRIVHRDVKPENIFIDAASGRALLADFGIARRLDADTQLTLAGSSVGTPSYMAPEQVKGGELDERADVYSLGLVGWEMLTGVRPWEGETLYDVLHKQQHEQLPSLGALRPDIPAYLLVAIEGALAKAPCERWPNGAEFLARLTPTPARLPQRPPRDTALTDHATIPLRPATDMLAEGGVSAMPLAPTHELEVHAAAPPAAPARDGAAFDVVAPADADAATAGAANAQAADVAARLAGATNDDANARIARDVEAAELAATTAAADAAGAGDVSTRDASTTDASTTDASTAAGASDGSTTDASATDASPGNAWPPDASMRDASTPDASTRDVSAPTVSMRDVSVPDASTRDTLTRVDEGHETMTPDGAVPTAAAFAPSIADAPTTDSESSPRHAVLSNTFADEASIPVTLPVEAISVDASPLAPATAGASADDAAPHVGATLEAPRGDRLATREDPRGDGAPTLEGARGDGAAALQSGELAGAVYASTVSDSTAEHAPATNVTVHDGLSTNGTADAALSTHGTADVALTTDVRVDAAPAPNVTAHEATVPSATAPPAVAVTPAVPMRRPRTARRLLTGVGAVVVALAIGLGLRQGLTGRTPHVVAAVPQVPPSMPRVAQVSPSVDSTVERRVGMSDTVAQRTSDTVAQRPSDARPERERVAAAPPVRTSAQVSRPPTRTSGREAPPAAAARDGSTRASAAVATATAPTSAATDARCSVPTLGAQRECLIAGIDRNDVQLTRTYHALIAQLRRRAGGGAEPPAVRALRREQRAWIDKRDRACESIGDVANGTLWGAERLPCFARQSALRDSVLRKRLQRRGAKGGG